MNASEDPHAHADGHAPRSIDLTEGSSHADEPGHGPHAGLRPFLMVTFTCANAYLRVYRARDGSHYLARCPKCAKHMRFVVGDGGSSQRVFQVSC
jgi:hypothetical protein